MAFDRGTSVTCRTDLVRAGTRQSQPARRWVCRGVQPLWKRAGPDRPRKSRRSGSGHPSISPARRWGPHYMCCAVAESSAVRRNALRLCGSGRGRSFLARSEVQQLPVMQAQEVIMTTRIGSESGGVNACRGVDARRQDQCPGKRTRCRCGRRTWIPRGPRRCLWFGAVTVTGGPSAETVLASAMQTATARVNRGGDPICMPLSEAFLSSGPTLHGANWSPARNRVD